MSSQNPTLNAAAEVLYRAMIPDPVGGPMVGTGPSMLGARVPTDIRPDTLGKVHSNRGGISVAPDDPAGLPPHFRPPDLGGFGALPIYSLSTSALGLDLHFRRDSKKPDRHGFVEPACAMLLEQYQRALADTKCDWRERT